LIFRESNLRLDRQCCNQMDGKQHRQEGREVSRAQPGWPPFDAAVFPMRMDIHEA